MNKKVSQMRNIYNIKKNEVVRLEEKLAKLISTGDSLNKKQESPLSIKGKLSGSNLITKKKSSNMTIQKNNQLGINYGSNSSHGYNSTSPPKHHTVNHTNNNTLLFDIKIKSSEQDRYLSNISKNLHNTSTNLKEVNTEIYQQGETLNKINDVAYNANFEVEEVDAKIDSIEYKNMCYSIILHALVVLLGIAIIIVVIIKFYARM